MLVDVQLELLMWGLLAGAQDREVSAFVIDDSNFQAAPSYSLLDEDLSLGYFVHLCACYESQSLQLYR